MVKFAGTTSTYVPPEISAGLHVGRFDSVEEKVIEKSQFDPNVYEWTFTILNSDGSVMYDEGEPIVLNGLTSRSFNVTSKTTPKAVKWFKALATAAEFAQFVAAANGEADPIDPEVVIGRKANVLVEIDEDTGRVRITDVIAMAQPGKGKGKAAAAPAAEAPASDEDAKAAQRAALEAQLAALG